MFFLNQKFLAGQNFIIYNEGSVIYTNTEFLSFSYKLPTYVVMIVNSQEHTYSLYSSIFVNYYSTNSLPLTKYTTFKNKFNFLFSNISYLISNSLYGCAARFRLIGRGYKAFPLINTYMYKLGYSHSIYYTMPLQIRIKKKTKKMAFHQFIGLWSHKTNLYLSEIKSFRLPDVYCAKGIFERGQFFEKKEGKKAFTL
jgi:ribosomal protein L6P/L9E